MPVEKPVRMTALNRIHELLGAKMVEDAGWLRPVVYSSVEEEMGAILRSAGICDVSPMGKIDVKGLGVGTLLHRIFHVASESGTRALIIGLPRGANGEQICCRLGSNHLLILTSPQDVDQMLTSLHSYGERSVYITEVASGFTAIEVAGPSARELLSKLTDLNINELEFPNHSCAEGRFAEVYSILLRLDYPSTLRYIVLVTRDYGAYVWNAIISAGEEFSVKPFGLAARRALGANR